MIIGHTLASPHPNIGAAPHRKSQLVAWDLKRVVLMTHTALGGLHLASICLWAWPMPYTLHHEKCHEPGLPTAAEGQELGRGAAQHQALQDTPFSLLCLFLTTNGLRGQLRGSALTPKQALRSWDGLKPALCRILLTPCDSHSRRCKNQTPKPSLSPYNSCPAPAWAFSSRSPCIGLKRLPTC